MATISIDFLADDVHVDCDDFEVSTGVESDIVDRMDELECNSWEISDWDDDYPDPSDFSDLDEYAEIVDKIDEHGEAYYLRWQDIGDFDFDDQYNGCWGSEEEFAQDLCESCYDIPDFLCHYIDWEKWARDVMMDYSSYEASDGYHIFRD